MRRRQPVLLALAVGLVVASGGMQAIAKEHPGKEHPGTTVGGALDGKVFVGEVGKKDKTKGDKDEFQFHDGKFHSVACDPYGFQEAAYTTAAQGGMITFTAETTSPTDGRMMWKGNVTGDSIKGTATWYKGKKPPQEHWFKGVLKKRKARGT